MTLMRRRTLGGAILDNPQNAQNTVASLGVDQSREKLG